VSNNVFLPQPAKSPKDACTQSRLTHKDSRTRLQGVRLPVPISGKRDKGSAPPHTQGRESRNPREASRFRAGNSFGPESYCVCRSHFSVCGSIEPARSKGLADRDSTVHRDHRM
jgi:hypothetical protein